MKSTLFWEHPLSPLEKKMATHCNILSWRIPGMEEPGGLPSMGSHGVRKDWCYLAAAAASALQHSWFKTDFSLLQVKGNLSAVPSIDLSALLAPISLNLVSTLLPSLGPLIIIFFNIKSLCYLKKLFILLVPHSIWYLSSSTREESGAPAVEVQSFNHWTAREVPVWVYFDLGPFNLACGLVLFQIWLRLRFAPRSLLPFFWSLFIPTPSRAVSAVWSGLMRHPKCRSKAGATPVSEKENSQCRFILQIQSSEPSRKFSEWIV